MAEPRYGPVGGEMVLIAAVGVRPDQFRVRKVTDWEVYDLDAVAAPGPAARSLTRPSAVGVR